MFQKALMGVWATCVCLIPQLATAANSNIVLYATDSSSPHGNWARVADPTAAGGQAVTSSDNGWSNTVGPLASPSDFVDFTFAAPSATTYHVWLRMRAAANSKYNDSVFAQFSDAVNGSGAALFAIGTTNGLTVNLASDSTGNGLSGWGWQDGAYWLTQPTTIAFANGGSHTLRIQTREDGVSIDQVVISSTTYVTASPGSLANDATIVPKPGTGVPTPWSSQDVGSTGLAGSASFANGVFTVAGAGADIWGAADAFQFVSQAVAGDAQIVARVADLQNVNAYAKGGVMFRDTPTAGSAHVLLDVRPNGSIEFMSRAAAGAATTFLAGGTQPAPAWLRLTRSGTTFTGETSPDGATWALVGSTSVALAANASIGLVVGSHDTTRVDTGTFDNVSVTLPPSAPGLPTPVDTAIGIGLSAPLAWSATGATSYDVNFGTTNPPARVATGLTSAAYTASAMMNGATYFWQVIAHNAAGTASGPVWSFTAIVAPPAAPSAPTPTSGAISVPTTAPLTWTPAAGATKYDVRFGTPNPPPAAATSLTSALFTPSTLTNGATYYWQVIARNAGGMNAGPVWSFTAIVAAPDAPSAPAPTVNAVNVATNTPLTWTAASGATSYDLSFGTGNPPALVATDLAATAYAPSMLTNGATYYWQVTARNAGGTTAGPVWSFTAIVAAPDAPSAPAPTVDAVNVATNTPLTWTAASGATSYDLSFGTTNPPPPVAAGLTSPSFAPTGVTSGTAYYWQVMARNAGGVTAGPVWSFTAIVAAPDAPSAPVPTASAVSVATNTPLTWTAASRATSYDLSFGTTNPPRPVAAGLTSPSFAPTGVTSGTAYYWQVVARNAGDATAGPVWSFTTMAAAPTPTNTIVLYAADASNLHGNWALVADATAAGGQTLSSADRGWANTGGPLATPADYFDFTFPAPAATSYHVWLRMRAAANSKYNDSVFAQFSDAAANGASLYALGTTNGLSVNLANDSSGNGLSGWGWQDGAYWLAQVTTIKFATTGSHTLRIQTREDGVSIDQVVLSATTYLTSAPGPRSGDTTIVAKPTSTPPPPTPGGPAAYNAISDRNAYVKPPLPQLGPAGFAFADPTFGSSMRRVTDGQTRPGIVNRSFRVASNAHLTAWNASSTAFYVISNDGTVIPYSFDPATMTASRIQATGTANGGLTLAFYVEPQFSLVNPNVIYGAVSGTNNRTISQYDFGTDTYSTAVDLDTIVGGLAGTYVGGLMSGGTPAEKLMTFFGGGSQDSHYYVLWAPVGNIGGRKLLNTVTSTINGAAIGTTLNFHLHSAQIDRSGRFVFLYPTAVDLGSPRYAAQVYVWDTSSNAVTAITSGGNDGAVAMRPGGHDAAGYGTWVNQDCCTSSSWDAAQWQFRQLTSLFDTSDLISPSPAAKEVYLADHTTWNNAQPTALLPVISSTYRYGNNTAPWRAWDDEIIGIDTTNGGGGLVWRFAHHRSLVASDSNPAAPYFWYEPIANVSPDGRWVIFTSNWEKTLGTDSSEGTFRQDVFLVQLTRP